MTNDKQPKQPKQPKKQYYDIKVDCIAPITYTYRIYADDEQSALKEIYKRPPTSSRPNYQARKILKATVFNAGSSLIKFVKKFV